MTIEDILTILNTKRKGQIVTLTTRRSAKVRKGSAPLTKLSVYQVRIGHDYEAQASTIAARAEGMEHRAEADDYAKRLNEHLTFHKESGRVYLACQPNPNPNAPRSAVFVEADGVSTLTKAEALPRLLASEDRDSSNTLHLRVPVDTIITLS